MKIIISFLAILLSINCAYGKEKTYTGSTPAGIVVRNFLDIPLTDSVDFIRWKFIITDNQYQLQCNYGINKPNTNGFINNGKKIELSGLFSKEKNWFRLQNGDKVLQLAQLNENLLHLLDEANKLLVGNGGWSYTLNNITPIISDQLSITPEPTVIKDSMAFEGRSPCKIPGVVPAGTDCYKLKWLIFLYGNAAANKPGTYKVLGTPYRQEGGRTGNWEIITGKNSSIIYQLNDEKGNPMLRLLKLNENILVFTDTSGQLLSGDEDFSYTLNKRF